MQRYDSMCIGLTLQLQRNADVILKNLNRRFCGRKAGETSLIR